jgi:uncharacterized protein YndB with AHSA1/START domain
VNRPSRAAEITLLLDAGDFAPTYYLSLDVWKALADAHELTRWFPLQADVESRIGGRVSWRWGDHFAMVSRVYEWQPHRLLRLIQERESPHAANGAPLSLEPAVRVLMEFTLDTHQGKIATPSRPLWLR